MARTLLLVSEYRFEVLRLAMGRTKVTRARQEEAVVRAMKWLARSVKRHPG